MAPRTYLSVIVPEWNEKDSLTAFVERFDAAFREYKEPFELLVVDDGSTDGSYELLRALQPSKPYLNVIKLNAHYGRDAAIVAGLRFSAGLYAATISADLQYDPSDIFKLLDEAKKTDPDLVCGYVEKPPSAAEYRYADSVRYSIATGGRLKDPLCSLRLISRSLVERAQQYHGNTYSPTVLLPRMAKRLGQVPVLHSPRKFGRNRLQRGPNSLPKAYADTWLRYEMFSWPATSAGILVALSALAFTLYTFFVPSGLTPTDVEQKLLILLAIVGFFGGGAVALLSYAVRTNSIYSLPIPEPIRYESADVYSAPRPPRPERPQGREPYRDHRPPQRQHPPQRQQQQRTQRPPRAEEETPKPPPPSGPVTFESVIFLQSENERVNSEEVQEPRSDGHSRQ
ncbi:MAG: glycosyltransferase family 2 protein, partial [Candidatus Brocadiia bacterium]